MAKTKPVKPKKKKTMKSNNWVLIALIVAVAVALFIVFAVAATRIFQTENYYVLNQDVPTRTQITPDMLDAITASEGTAPAAAIGIEEVQSGEVYTQYPLLAGDILTMSNVGGREDISVGIPDEWVVTNFSVGADDAVGGRIQRGTYFDLMIVQGGTKEEGGGTTYPFVNILALDTTVDLNSASSSEAAESEEAHDGQTTQYVVGMSPEDAGKLQHIMEQYGSNVKLVLSPRQNEYNAPQLNEYTGKFAYDQADQPKNMGENTDYTFRDVERDEFGVPLEEPGSYSCSNGNAKISGEDCEGTETNSQENITEDTANTETTDEGN